MFENIPRDVLNRYISFHTTPLNEKTPGISFLMNYFNNEFLDSNVLLCAPLHVVLKITSNCNLNCLHCSQKPQSNKALHGHMSNWRSIVDSIVDLGVIYVSITGGEPMLHPEFKQIVAYIKEKGLIISILTNGILLDEDTAHFLSTVLDRRHDAIRISLDDIYDNFSKIRTGGNFGLLTENITKLKQCGIKIQAAMVINNMNYKNMSDVYLFCINHGIGYIRFMTLFKHNLTSLENVSDLELLMEFDKVLNHHKDNSDKIVITSDPLPLVYTLLEWLEGNDPLLYSQLTVGKYMCPAGVVSCEVGEQGNVYPCSYLDMDEFIIGNIQETNFTELWQTSSLWLNFRDRTPKNDTCQNCKQVNYCFGGCPASSFYKNNKFGDGDRNCYIINSKCTT